ncbi:MAG TPA: hypothetical protein PKW55_01730 [Spirochaetota bacterium]|nr:hypothetical protein [Spirochaetota bacterium]HOM38985.1 hypothetical protein [Spirochaetota bacterium]HPQ48355.1 hypothetical protein [Spirochaetota bacterium]
MKKSNNIFLLTFLILIINLFNPLYSAISTFEIGLSYNYFNSVDYNGYNTSLPVVGVSISGSDGLNPRLKIVGGYKNIKPILPDSYVKESSYFVSGFLGGEYLLDFNDFILSFSFGISYKHNEIKMRLTTLVDYFYSYKGYRKVGAPFSISILKIIDFFVLGTEIELDLIKLYSQHYEDLLTAASGYGSYERINYGGYTDNTLSIFFRVGIYY